MMTFYDFEVFKYDWIAVCIEPFKELTNVIINDSSWLEHYYKEHVKDIWVGYNSRNYDVYILKAILLGFNPKTVSDFIIEEGKKGWQYSSLFNDIKLNNYDCMDKFSSLKQLEGYMGNDIKETSVPFDIDRLLTKQELDETVKYCIHDVEQTMLVFNANKADFDAHLNILKTFNLPIHNISKTQAQLSAQALGCVKKERYDEWDLTFIDTLRIEKYKEVIDWFKDQIQNVRNYDNQLVIDVLGVPHKFGWGGLHGAPVEPVHRKGLLLHVDVNSFYPSIMIKYDLLSRNVQDKSVFKQVYDYRLQLKKAGKKKEQAPYKIILNSTFGICKDPYNPAYDPRRANEVTVNGQLLLLDLLEHLEGHCELIQSNTDGLIIQIEDTDEAFERIDDICYEWETRTGMTLGLDVISEIFQKDVNNYVWIDEDGNVERKGGYVKPLNELDNYMVNKIPIEDTINGSDKLKDFQKIVKISSKYICGMHNHRKLTDKTFRVFASKNNSDTAIFKVKNKQGNEVPEKFANTPVHCFIDNGDVNGVTVPDKLDKQWYINLAKDRLKQYGVN